MTNKDHFCTVCGIKTTRHPEPFWAMTTKFFINPCCDGCDCLTFEEFLMNSATDEEKAYAFEHMNRKLPRNKCDD